MPSDRYEGMPPTDTRACLGLDPGEAGLPKSAALEATRGIVVSQRDNARSRFNLVELGAHLARSIGVRRLGVTDHALHGGERATQCALDRIDAIMDLDDTHRGRRAAMKVDD